jgi:hypothetical protein
MKMKKMHLPKLHMKKMRMSKPSSAPMGKMPSPLKGSAGAAPMPGPNEFSADDEMGMRQGAAAARAAPPTEPGAAPPSAMPAGLGDDNLA